MTSHTTEFCALAEAKGDLVLHLEPEPLPTAANQVRDEELDLSMEQEMPMPEEASGPPAVDAEPKSSGDTDGESCCGLSERGLAAPRSHVLPPTPELLSWPRVWVASPACCGKKLSSKQFVGLVLFVFRYTG